MKSCLRTLGASLANSEVIPAAWLSGLATIGLLWGMIRFSPDKLTAEGRQIFLASISIFLPLHMALDTAQAVSKSTCSIHQPKRKSEP
jgi:hypothetical protein